MHKSASKAMKHALRVDTIDPTKGFIEGGAGEDYIVANADNLDADQCGQELRQLAGELAKANNELLIAKQNGDAKAVAFIGGKIAALCARRSPFKARLNSLKQEASAQILGELIREFLPLELQRTIFEEAKRRLGERFA